MEYISLHVRGSFSHSQNILSYLAMYGKLLSNISLDCSSHWSKMISGFFSDTAAIGQFIKAAARHSTEVASDA